MILPQTPYTVPPKEGVAVKHHQFAGANAYKDVGSTSQATITLRTNTGSINLRQR